MEKHCFWAALCYSLLVPISTQNDCANLMLLLLEFSPLLSNCLLQVPLFFLPEIRKRSRINDWIITVSHKSGTSCPATNMRHRVPTTVQEFCPDSSKTVLFLSSKNKRHQSAASRSQSYCSRLYSNFTRVNWPSLKQWAFIQWKNTEGSVWNDLTDSLYQNEIFQYHIKMENQEFPWQSKNKMNDFISPSFQLFLGNWSLSLKYFISMIQRIPVSQVLDVSDLL